MGPQSWVQGIGTFFIQEVADNGLLDARVDETTNELLLLITPIIFSSLTVMEKVMVGHTLLSSPPPISIKRLWLNTLAFEEIDNLVWNFGKDLVC